ncbi:MAG: hypothetical protein ACLFT5_07610, partial [Desulfovermiculus sp.]
MMQFAPLPMQGKLTCFQSLFQSLGQSFVNFCTNNFWPAPTAVGGGQKLLLTNAPGYVGVSSSKGAVAQLGERLNGIQEVRS